MLNPINNKPILISKIQREREREKKKKEDVMILFKLVTFFALIYDDVYLCIYALSPDCIIINVYYEDVMPRPAQPSPLTTQLILIDWIASFVLCRLSVELARLHLDRIGLAKACHYTMLQLRIN